VPAGPLAGAGTDTFDGNGGITTTATLSINGNIVSLTATGSYKVNPDCTGTYKVQATTLFLVTGDNGNEIHAICIDPGVVLSHTFKRQFPAGSGLQSINAVRFGENSNVNRFRSSEA
jgi:hypothetical protein